MFTVKETRVPEGTCPACGGQMMRIERSISTTASPLDGSGVWVWVCMVGKKTGCP